MAFDFPSSPTTGQTYSVSGGPTYVYNGTAWVVLTPGNQFNRTVFTATAGQTTFTMTYVVGAIDVYRNGVKLVNTADFTATNGTSIVLLNAATVGDTIEVISYPMITYSDAVKRTGDTMTGGLTVPTFNVSGTGNTFSQITAPSTSFSAQVYINRGGSNNTYIGPTSDGYFDIFSTECPSGFRLTVGGNTRLTIDSNGRIVAPSQPAFQAQNSTVVTYNNQYVVYNTSQFNTGNHYSTSTGRFTAPVSGRYMFYASAYRSSNDFGHIRLAVNQGNYYSFTEYAAYANNSHGYTMAIISLSAGDYVSVYAAGTNTKVDSNNYFGGYLIG